ncbi:MAG: CinA family protein [Ruminococcaceae bacterium]|nr:CinA family protein [Oscillospiraceae bacterium]
MMSLACNVLKALARKTLATAESCTGGMIGEALTDVAGASKVYKGGIISYCNEAKRTLLGVDGEILGRYGPVSLPVAKAMAEGAAKALNADVAVSVTGLAGPDGDEYGNPVGRVYIGYADSTCAIAREFTFSGDREAVRRQAAEAALDMILKYNQ